MSLFAHLLDAILSCLEATTTAGLLWPHGLYHPIALGMGGIGIDMVPRMGQEEDLGPKQEQIA